MAAHQAAALEQRLATLEASYVDRDTEHSNRLNELEAIRIAHMTDDNDERVATLEKATAELAAWRPDMEGVLEDVRCQVEKINSKCDRMVFDNTPHSIGLLRHSPLMVATAPSSSELKSPKGHGVAMTTRDMASRVVTTWTHIPAMGKPYTTHPPADPPGFVFPPLPPPPHPNPPPIPHLTPSLLPHYNLQPITHSAPQFPIPCPPP
jgi:hypothetical protein